MICSNCGAEVKDGSKFCVSCGHNIENGAGVQNNAPKKKGIGNKKPIIIAVAAVAVLVILGVCFNTFAMSFASAKTQLKHAYTKEVKNLAKDLETGLSDYRSSIDKDAGVEGSISFEISDTIMGMVEQYAGINGLSDINNATVNYEVSSSDNKLGYSLGLACNGTNILTGEMVADMGEGVMALSLPELNQQALFIEVAEDEMQGMDMNQMMDIYKGVIPDKGMVEKLLPKYIETVLDQVDEVDRENVTLEIEGVSQKAKVLTLEINGKLVKDVLIAILEEAKEDKEILNYLEDIYEYIEIFSNEMGEELDSWSKMEEEFYSGLDELIQEIKETDDENILDGETISIKTYVDSKFEIIGIGIDYDAEAVKFLAAKASKGNDIGCEISFKQDEIEIMEVSGSGKESSGKFTGQISLKVQGEEYVYLDFENFTTKNDKINGKVTVSTASTLWNEFGSTMDDGLMPAQLISTMKFVVDMDVTDKKYDIGIAVEGLGTEMFKLSINGKQGKAKSINMPTDGTYDQEEWASGLDTAQLLTNLGEALPIDLFSLLGGMDSDMLY